MALAHFNLGNTYMNLNEFELSMSHLSKAIDLATKYDDKFVKRWGLYSMGQVSYFQSNLPKAISFFEKALQINLISNDDEDVELTTACYLQLGESYLSNGDLIKSEQNFQLTIDLASIYDFVDYQVDGLSGMAVIWEKRERYLKVIECYKKTIPLLENIEPIYSLAVNHEIIGDMYCNIGQLKMALGFYIKSHQYHQTINSQATEGVSTGIKSIKEEISADDFHEVIEQCKVSSSDLKLLI